MLYPIITESRQLIDLSGIWKFKLNEGNGLTEELSKSTIRRYHRNGCTIII